MVKTLEQPLRTPCQPLRWPQVIEFVEFSVIQVLVQRRAGGKEVQAGRQQLPGS
jgi:hypothetical protein